MGIIDSLRHEALCVPMSGIDAVINHGRSKPGLIALWAGESELVTPAFIRDAATTAVEAGETFYTWQTGIPALREALARYHTRHFGREFHANEFTVTNGGMHAILLALQATAGAGDEIIYLTPGWPNLVGAAAVAGAVPVPVPLRISEKEWVCDVTAIETAITPRTKAIFINTPSNPTGWVATREELRAIIELSRRFGLWIIADEIYSRFAYGMLRAPSFADVMEQEDRIIFVNTFSKNWAMTGWRIGWLNTHPSLSQKFATLVQYSTSGVPQFLQRGAIAALDHGDDYVNAQVTRALAGRDLLVDILKKTGRIDFAVPKGAFYLLFSIAGLDDSAQAAIELIDRAKVGVAPGSAFGDAGNGFLRICFLRDIEQLKAAADKIDEWVRSR
ncbi:pyridoxal phosphate-dependent aminotransferase [Phyllobacterium myrsinacearum]|uniref:aspartate transaminase n=1 Tax=Phyllobacterium myrsinacearum TaxID=28101 RepID=A0A2S9JQM6_9HYPH|nr:pyridoxal phosphate-dependent aminotransferase [Phyllobacterium myrsinacearum]PRD55546.1 aspartate aminotransferase [Phyllobacterium myrsinacearum]PWV91901.1 aspartate/methionine/tyrosine aminotransferase [Phyllobacterium myrsinacearum]RZV05968.1 aspartate/methionine/tyrosine aminotransferase [Phyllobacterium myrsinacearum]